MNKACWPMLFVYEKSVHACNMCAFYTLNIVIPHKVGELAGPIDECDTCKAKDMVLHYGA
jgi:hypothetical protein